MGSSGGFAEALPYGAGGSARIRLCRRLLLDHGDRTQQYTVVGFRIPSVETNNHAKPVTQVAEGVRCGVNLINSLDEKLPTYPSQYPLRAKHIVHLAIRQQMHQSGRLGYAPAQ
jgi:hypothetical protein